MNKKLLTHLRRIQKIIYIFGDNLFQERVWLLGIGPEVSSYEENRSQLYDDLDFEDFLENHAKALKEGSFWECLSSWNEIFNEFDENIPTDENGFVEPSNLLSNKSFIEFREKSKLCAEMLDQKIILSRSDISM